MPDPGAPLSPAGGAEAAGGTVRPIVMYPDPVLRVRCAPAGEMMFDPIRTLVADLLATLYASGGRGLAAPQIGVTRRVFVMDAGWKTGAPTPLTAIEPDIIFASPDVVTGEERCLSIPDHPVQVTRPASIRLAYFDLDGVRHEAALDGAAARIAQHELDHLNGVLILDAEVAGQETPA